MKSFRSSFTPVAGKCAASTELPMVKLLSGGVPADTGSGAHEILTAHVDGDSVDMDEVATKWRVDAGELKSLAYAGMRCWEQLSPWFPDAQSEVELKFEDARGFELTGHADVLSYVEATSETEAEVRVLDWKSGYSQEDSFEDQLRSYAWLGMHKYPDAQQAYVVVVRLRDQTAEGKRYSRQELAQWWERLVVHLSDTSVYNPGSWCWKCPRSHECQARKSIIRQALGSIMGAKDIMGMLPEEPGPRATVMIQLLDKCRLVQPVMEKLREQIRIEVQANGGRMLTDDGRELYVKETERTEIAFSQSWDKLSGVVPKSAYDNVFSVNKGDLEDAVRASAPRGKKGGAVKELLADLAASGALVKKSITRLETRRAALTAEDSNKSEVLSDERNG